MANLVVLVGDHIAIQFCRVTRTGVDSCIDLTCAFKITCKHKRLVDIRFVMPKWVKWIVDAV